MNFKRTVLLLTIVVTLGLLLGTSAAQAQTVISSAGNATEILDLEVNGVLYNVEFVSDNGLGLYGEPPVFPFSGGQTDTINAANAVNDALNNAEERIDTVGPDGSAHTNDYLIGFDTEEIITPIFIAVRSFASADWQLDFEGFEEIGLRIVAMWAKFTEVDGPQPDPVTIGGTVTGLEGSGLVLQNNGGDDLPIDSNGDFEFETPLAPDSTYDVTVITQPSNPAQICDVENGSGTVPEEDVTDVAVTCAEPILGDVIKAAAEGETLLDGTILKQILLDGGVAISPDGQVAFGGKDDDNTIAALTSDGLETRVAVREGDTLTDGTTTVDDISIFGEVAINGQSGDRVAFHGRTGRDKAVFTQAGLVAREGDTLAIGTLNQIKEQGKVAITIFDQVAFHGKIKIEDGGSLFDAVLTSDGLETRVAVREGDTLTDDNTVETIDETGGVAINDFFDEVAFHGDVVDPDDDGDTKKAVFTSEVLIAKEGDTLADGTTNVDDIDETGGVAINIFGVVAFHGDVVHPDDGTGTVRAVFTQEGLVAKEGDTLPDGTILQEISESGGVAINFSGDVAFHGRTGGVKAVFTQNRLVAKEGDTLADGSILGEIHNTGGVAINPYGLQVAFLGKVGIIDAVFVGQAPEAPVE